MFAQRQSDGRFALVTVEVELEVDLDPALDPDALRELLAKAEGTARRCLADGAPELRVDGQRLEAARRMTGGIARAAQAAGSPRAAGVRIEVTTPLLSARPVYSTRTRCQRRAGSAFSLTALTGARVVPKRVTRRRGAT